MQISFTGPTECHYPMKSLLVPLLVLSLAGNVVLSFLRLRPAASAPGAVPAATAASAHVPAAVQLPATAPSETVLSPNTWQTLKPGQDLHTLVGNLRAAGFPPSVIRAVASQLISERLGSGGIEHLPFWKQTPNNPEFIAAQQQQAVQRREMLSELLGPDARPSALLDPAVRERRYGQLPDEKVDQLEAMTRDYNDLRSKLFAERKTGDMSGTAGAWTAVEAEQHAELATILTPAELEQYEMRSSASATRLMAKLKNIDVTEAEYTSLFHAQNAFDVTDPMRGGVVTADAMMQRTVALAQLNEQARTVLPDDRFYEYLKVADLGYAEIAKFGANYPAMTPAMSYDLSKIEKEFQSASMAFSRTVDGGPLPPEKAGQLMAARKEYESKINTLLGSEIAAAYLRRNRTGRFIASGPGGG